ncbi:MAG: hypothetical protein CME64_01340 [Halobacteriovoraceae bacterium]|nr:hypothetical protein [Halobacteriovoraceae bacterium]
MARIKILFLMLISFGCSTAKIQSTSSIPVTFESKTDHTRDISVEVQRDYYLWGLLPSTHNIALDKEFERVGAKSVAEVSIEEVTRKTNIVWSVLTFGFYTPNSYVLRGKSN